jgi:hypothetical protein
MFQLEGKSAIFSHVADSPVIVAYFFVPLKRSQHDLRGCPDLHSHSSSQSELLLAFSFDVGFSERFSEDVTVKLFVLNQEATS